jgi:hypothetical protein
MKLNLGEVMFHELRQFAAQQVGIEEIFVRTYQGGNSLDQYYLLRGCQLVRRPARLQSSASTQLLVRCLMPRKYSQILGE